MSQGQEKSPPDGTVGTGQITVHEHTSTPDNDKQAKLTRFLAAIFARDDLIEVRPIEAWVEDGKKRSRPFTKERCWIKPEELLGRAEDLAKLSGRPHFANIFFGVCPRPRKRAGKKEDICLVRTLWADVDDCSTEDAQKRTEGAGLPKPTIVVNSGHGVHLYWVLAEPFQINGEEDRCRVEHVLKQISLKIKGDAVQNLDRLLRLPGFDNVKDARNGTNSTAQSRLKRPVGLGR